MLSDLGKHSVVHVIHLQHRYYAATMIASSRDCHECDVTNVMTDDFGGREKRAAFVGMT